MKGEYFSWLSHDDVYYPDKVETLGEDIKKAAEQKFKQINEAKEIVYKARGMK